MVVNFLTNAEKRAELAENLSCFQGIKLLNIRNSVKTMLDLIGRNNIFDQYTVHNISHVDAMLSMTDWLIPSETQDALTHGEWLTLVLSIYFHDLGMLVTKDEYNARNSNSSFKKYEDGIYSNSSCSEFKEKIESLGEEKEKFLYQEFVRSTHADRISSWIEGVPYSDHCKPIFEEIDKILNPLEPMYRKDLALVCKSHHLDDLGDFQKYRTSVKYDMDKQSWVNLHYISIIMRTADLLHITSDRTPSIQYRIINPSDPISIIEWKKQTAVKALTPKVKMNQDGSLDDKIPKDQIEVTAFFDKPDQADAFFGLQSYLEYAKVQIRRNYDFVQQAIKQQNAHQYLYPWQGIYDDDIVTTGFENRKLQFTLDQQSILDLLVGNTLYNNPSVVIRELIQNSIDAVKLQRVVEKIENRKITSSQISIGWDSSTRILSVLDNGTGMSLGDVENYLLKVGSSKYRTDDFRKKYPDFSAISRFGIGILTCFLISDDIDILTNSNSEDVCNLISIKKLGGKYLLKKIPKGDAPQEICDNGTVIKLHVRSDVKMENILSAVKFWILFPPCPITIYNDTELITVGYKSPREALVDLLSKEGYTVDDKNTKVVQVNRGGIDLAYATEFSEYTNEWNFLNLKTSSLRNDITRPIGVCIEGVRVTEFITASYLSNPLIAIANIQGHPHLKTNVARTAMEYGNEWDDVSRAIYQVYADHIQNQIESLFEQGYSFLSASYEALWLAKPFLGEDEEIFEENRILYQVFSGIKCIAVEYTENSDVVSPSFIQELESINIIDSAVLRNVDIFLRDSNSSKTAAEVVNFIGLDLGVMKDIPSICNFSARNFFHRVAIKNKETSLITINRDQKQISYLMTNDHKWDRYFYRINERRRINYSIGSQSKVLFMPISKSPIQGLNCTEIGVVAFNGIYLNSEHEAYLFIKDAVSQFGIGDKDVYLLSVFLGIFVQAINYGEKLSQINFEKIIDDEFENNYRHEFHSELTSDIWERVDKTCFVDEITKRDTTFYDPMNWSRSRDFVRFY